MASLPRLAVVISSLRPLRRTRQIECLELWMIRGFGDLSEVADLTQQRYLFLQALEQVTSLPELARCSRPSASVSRP